MRTAAAAAPPPPAAVVPAPLIGEVQLRVAEQRLQALAGLSEKTRRENRDRAQRLADLQLASESLKDKINAFQEQGGDQAAAPPQTRARASLARGGRPPAPLAAAAAAPRPEDAGRIAWESTDDLQHSPGSEAPTPQAWASAAPASRTPGAASLTRTRSSRSMPPASPSAGSRATAAPEPSPSTPAASARSPHTSASATPATSWSPSRLLGDHTAEWTPARGGEALERRRRLERRGGDGLPREASEAASVGAAAAAGLAAKGAKAVKTSLKENLGSFTASTHTFQDGLAVVTVCRLAEGGFGEVLKCRDQRSGKEYAMKVIHCQEGVQVASTLRAAELEAKVLRGLPAHPNIIQCVGHSVERVPGTGNGVVKLVLELCPGGTLMDYMDRKNGKLAAKEIMEPLAQIASAVRHMHSQRPPIQHRDLKVENVLKAVDGSWKLCDFGSCSVESVPAKEMSRAQIMAIQEDIDKTVTMLYRPPEMVDLELNFRNGYAITELVDLWMIGCILFTLAFYMHPFQDNASPAGIQNARFFIPTDHDMAKSPKFCALIHWLLAPDPNDRPSSARLCDVIRDLPKTGYEELFGWLPPSVQAKQRKFADTAAKQARQGSAADEEITPEMARALAAGKGRPAAGRRTPGGAGADSPPPAGLAQQRGSSVAFDLSGSQPARPSSGAVAPAPPMDDLLGFGGAPAPPAPQVVARGKSAPAVNDSDLLAFIGGDAPPAPAPAVRHVSAPAAQQGNLLGFDAPALVHQPPSAAVPAGAAQDGAFWAADFADFSAGPPAPQAALAPAAGGGFAPPAQGGGGDLLSFGEDFADFARAPPPKVSGSQGLGLGAATAAPATGNLLDF
ncbi:unnamed protein product [Prorocentrum cordatum]|uniref:non-specific serine/threonine protein kinase n=1 Tax=Prorocentrum cordatum TaxID=2364126 RepID=A0ABN9UAV3_9DINO|nr:unnamed protein product [Polarella glacialis]